MGNAFLYGCASGSGSGGDIKESLVIQTYTSEEELPETADEGTIAIITDIPVTYYTVSNNYMPDPIGYGAFGSSYIPGTLGEIYIKASKFSPAEVVITDGNNSFCFFPVSVYQCVASSGDPTIMPVEIDAQVFGIDALWEKKVMMVYYEGQWRSLEQYVIKSGEKCNENTDYPWGAVTDANGNGSILWDTANQCLRLQCKSVKGSYASIWSSFVNIEDCTHMRIKFSELSHIGTYGVKIGITNPSTGVYGGTTFSDIDNNMLSVVENRLTIDDLIDGWMTIDLRNITDPHGIHSGIISSSDQTLDGFPPDLSTCRVQIAVTTSNVAITDIYLYTD